MNQLDCVTGGLDAGLAGRELWGHDLSDLWVFHTSPGKQAQVCILNTERSRPSDGVL